MRASDSAVTKALEASGHAPGAEIAREIDAAKGDQAALFELEDEAALTLGQFGVSPVAISGKGRKRGARNRTTQKTVDLILSRGRDPLLAMADVVSMSPEQVREVFKLDAEKAARMWLDCARELAPYVHSKKPTQIEGHGLPLVPIQIIMGHASGLAAPTRIGGQERVVIDAPLTPVKSGTCEDEGEEVTQDDSHTGASSD